MKLLLSLVLTASGTALLCLAEHNSASWTSYDEGITSKTIALNSEPMRVVVDNLNGYVHVKAIDTSEVHVSAHKRIEAETPSDLDQGRKEVKLQITQEQGTATIYYDAP